MIGQTLLTSGIGGAIGSLLGIWWTAGLRFRYWQQERRVEARLAATREFNRLSAVFIVETLDAAAAGRTPSSGLSVDFFRDLQMVKAEIRARFSTGAYDAYMAAERLIPLPHGEILDTFVRQRDVVMKKLVEET